MEFANPASEGYHTTTVLIVCDDPRHPKRSVYVQQFHLPPDQYWFGTPCTVPERHAGLGGHDARVALFERGHAVPEDDIEHLFGGLGPVPDDEDELELYAIRFLNMQSRPKDGPVERWFWDLQCDLCSRIEKEKRRPGKCTRVYVEEGRLFRALDELVRHFSTWVLTPDDLTAILSSSK